MSDIYLLLTPILVLGVLALSGFVGCDRIVQIDEFEHVPLVVDENLMDPRSDFTGWVGMAVTPHPDDRPVFFIGRFCRAGNNQVHNLKIVDAATGLDVPDSSATIDLAGQPANQYAWVSILPGPILKAGSKYYVLSSETSGGDEFLDFTTTVTLHQAAPFLVTSAAFSDPLNDPINLYKEMGGANQSYGPVNLKYAARVD